MRLAPIPDVDLCFPFFITSPVLLPSPPIISTPLYPSPSFSIPLPLPLNLSSCSPPISVFLFSFYPRSESALFINRTTFILSTCPAHLSRLLTSFLVRLSHTNFLVRTPAILLTQLFSQTRSLSCCFPVIAMVSRPYRYAGVMHELIIKYLFTH